MASILLAAGHGMTPKGVEDRGTTYKTLVEHKLNEAAMFACADRLTAEGFTDWQVERGATRNSEDRKDGNWTAFRELVGGLAGVAVAVEFHHDYFQAPRGGFGIWPRRVGYNSSREREACESIAAAYRARGLPVRPSYADRRGLGLLNRPSCPTLIWECDRLGDVMTDPVRAGDAVAVGLLSWIGWTTAPVKPGLKRGSSGPDVEALQRLLGLKVNGAFGSATEAAVMALQRRHRLPVTGEVDLRTWGVLGVKP